jgi:hypothetical protein
MWAIANEFDRCEFGDSRLTNRVKIMSTAIAENPQMSLHAACGSAAESKAAYRFLQNDGVSSETILRGHVEQTLDRMASYNQEILIVHDTTDLVYTQFPSIPDIGELHKADDYEAGVRALRLHSSLAVTDRGIPLGILKQTFFIHEDYRKDRDPDTKNVKGSSKKLPIEQKQSYRWLDHFLATNKMLDGLDVKAIHVADRECDIFEFIQVVQANDGQYVIRSSSDRRTQEGDLAKDTSTIQKRLDLSKAIAEIVVMKDGKSIVCELRSITVELKAPQRQLSAASQALENLEVNVVEVKSKSGPKLHWRLLTNLGIDGAMEAIKVVEIYKKRWSIECFHRVLKSGFGVEKSRLGNRFRLENLASILSIVSWHLFWLYNFGRSLPNEAAETIFSKESIHVLKVSAKKLKVTTRGKLTVKKCIFILARLGGFAGRKGDGEPGMQSIWRGWRNLMERLSFLEELTCG